MAENEELRDPEAEAAAKAAKKKKLQQAGKKSSKTGLLIVSLIVLAIVGSKLYKKQTEIDKNVESQIDDYQKMYADEGGLILTIHPEIDTQFAGKAVGSYIQALIDASVSTDDEAESDMDTQPDDASEDDIAVQSEEEMTEEPEEPFIMDMNLQDYFVPTFQKAIYDALQTKKTEREYTYDDPLVLYNPFGTNELSLYMFYSSGELVKTEYFIHTPNIRTNNFHARCYEKGNQYSAIHEYSLTGLVQGTLNIITVRMETMDGKVYIRQFYFEVPGELEETHYTFDGEKPTKVIQVSKKETAVVNESDEPVTDDYFVVLGDSKCPSQIRCFDEKNVLRIKLPLLSGESKKLLTDDDKLIYNISDSEIVVVDHLGHVENIYHLGKYTIAGDYILGQKDDIIVAVTDNTQSSIADVVISIDRKSGNVRELIDLEDIMDAYKLSCTQNGDKLNWLGLNSMFLMGEGELMLSARETSSFIKVKDLYDEPKLDYLIGWVEFFKKTSMVDDLFYNEKRFVMPIGQTYAEFMPYDKIRKTRYYINVFDNNNGMCESRPDYNWDYETTEAAWDDPSITPGTDAEKGGYSFVYRLLVDEAENSVRLVYKIPIDYSGIDGNVCFSGDHMITVCSNKGTFTEWDSEFGRIKVFSFDKDSYLERVFKMNLKGVFFGE